MEYQFHTKSFDGPLDLLLHLISRSKIDIQDIFVSEITEQYMQYIAGMERHNMEVSSEFLTMAATLLHIKSRSLLPRANDEDEDETDPEAELIMRLEEYKLIKQAANHLAGLEEGAPRVYYKLPEEYTFQKGPLNLEGIGVNDLFIALTELMAARQEAATRKPRVNVVRGDIHSVRDKVHMLKSMLAQNDRLGFKELFNNDSSKDEIIATFLALLELIASGQARVEQEKLFDDISIYAQDYPVGKKMH